jgi:transcriptional regulator with GAF, ATPase, and Fis domain
MVSRRAAQAVAAIKQTPAKPAAPASHAQALAALGALRRDGLLEAMAVAAQELLRSSDLAASLQKIVERIGPTTGVDRAHIFLVDAERDDGLLQQHYLWTVPDLATPRDFATPSRPMAEIGLKTWIPRLKRGEIIESHVSDLDADARGLMELGGVKSVLAVPVIVDGRWLGIIGFDDCRSERQWSAAEIDMIKIVAELVGAAVERTARQGALADANRIIESSPTILYRLAPNLPFALTFVSQNVRRYGYAARGPVDQAEPLA